MTPRYAVRTILLASGERLPMLMDLIAREPMFDPVIYTVFELRAKNRASNSIESTLRAVMILYIFADLRHIDLERRLQEGQVLELGEIDELVRLCRLPMKKLNSMLATGEAAVSSRVASLEKYGMKQDWAETGNDVTSAATRVRYIRDYVFWFVNSRLSRHGRDQQSRDALAATAVRTTDAFNARIPSSKGRNTIGGREGIGQNAIDRLLSVIEPDSPNNPWLGNFAKKRNQLAIYWLYELGIRRGELLGLAGR